MTTKIQTWFIFSAIPLSKWALACYKSLINMFYRKELSRLHSWYRSFKGSCAHRPKCHTRATRQTFVQIDQRKQPDFLVWLSLFNYQKYWMDKPSKFESRSCGSTVIYCQKIPLSFETTQNAIHPIRWNPTTKNEGFLLTVFNTTGNWFASEV